MGVMLYFLLILAILLRQLFLSFNENFADKSRLLLLLFMGFALTSCLFFPTGILNFEKFESQNLLVASREAGANCKISLKLKENNTFSEKTVCFGTSETSGKYSFRNDTIFFEEVSLGRDEGYIYEFAVIRNK